MEEFEYADEKASDREIMIAVPSMIISVGVLSLPKDLADVTKFADGWFVILIGGLLAILFTWLAARLAVNFPHQSFMNYATLITTKPIAIVLSLFFSLCFLCISAYQIRKIADISKQYLFNQTPMEIIALAFFLVVIYAVSGPTIGLLRLNMMFLPIIIFISLIIIIFNLGWFSLDNLLPVFKTEMTGYAKGIFTSTLSYGGFSIVLFYISLVKKPKKTAQKAVIGMIIPIILYSLIFISALGVFGHSVTQNLLYPTVELAKTVDIPGGLLERFESIFFVIWIMAIFNTTAMAFDIAIINMNAIFKKVRKMKMIFIFAPIIYFISMLPSDLIDTNMFAMYISRVSYLYTLFVILLLLIIAKMRGVWKSND